MLLLAPNLEEVNARYARMEKKKEDERKALRSSTTAEKVEYEESASLGSGSGGYGTSYAEQFGGGGPRSKGNRDPDV